MDLASEHLTHDGNPDAPGHLLARIAATTSLEATPLTGRWLDIGNRQDLDRARASVGG
jgi:NDP-sugar pyrophosphorylase family protein